MAGLKMSEINRRWRLTNLEQSYVVEICQNESCEIKGITDYSVEGLNNGEGIIIFAPSILRKRVFANIKKVEPNFEYFRSHGQIKCFDLEFFLANISSNGIIIDKLFFELIGKSIVSSKKKFGKVRIYGGITAFFWEKGQYDIATYLENLWIVLLKKYKIFLFSSYLLIHHNSLRDDSLLFLYFRYNHLNHKKRYYPFRVEDNKLLNVFETAWRNFSNR